MSRNCFLYTEKISSKIILLMGIFLPMDAALAGEDGWLPVKMTRSGQIYHRSVGDSSFPWVMITTTFAANPARVHQLVTDYDNFAEFIPNVAESRIVLEEGGEQWVYHHLHFHAPVADRVYLIKSSAAESRPEEDFYKVVWNLVERPFPDVDLSAGITPDVFSGYWELRPGDQANSTAARYAIYSDPGGYLPGWLVGKMTDRYVQQVVQAFRDRLAQDSR